jgi:hypothetical protein
MRAIEKEEILLYFSIFTYGVCTHSHAIKQPASREKGSTRPFFLPTSVSLRDDDERARKKVGGRSSMVVCVSIE